MKRTCATCFAFEPPSELHIRNHRERAKGICRLRPPKLFGEGEYYVWLWPQVKQSDWCGCWKPADELKSEEVEQ